MNAAKTSKLPWPHKRAWICIFLVSLLFVWWGIPTIRKWRADKLVDELCAKHGGIRVYETVTLPAGMFNEYGQPKIRFWNKAISGGNTTDTGLYFSIESEDVVGSQNASDISKLAVWKSIVKLRRSSDGKVFGETIWYSRSGGDAFGPWHPSSHVCPDNASEWDLANKIVIKTAN